MDAQRWHKAARVFEECRKRPASERRSALRELCGLDDTLRLEVEELLDAHEREESGASDGVTSSAQRAVGQADLRRLGPYEVRERLGAGGMGVVYRAEQASPRRDVALKVLPAWLRTASGRARFEYEAQALGRLDHPNIARIYEAGSARDERGVEHAYFAMELVRGRPLDEVSPGLSVRERVALIETVCRAVHHAHQRGVIHRDLKPSNILVDETHSPRVLDFGVARVIDAERPAGGATLTGQIMGTVQYMSPEQAAGDPSRIDTRTDVYALGVMLYEALSGRLPHELDGLTLLSALREVSETRPAPLGDIGSPLQRDLEVILAKAMAKDPRVRYASAAALADDLARALRQEPILAHPPSTVYAMRKFVARNRPLVALGAAAALALAAGAASLAVGLARARAAEAVAVERLAEAEREATKAEAVREVLRSILVSVSPENTADREITVREAMDAARTQLMAEGADQPPEVRGAALWTMGSTYRALAQPEPAEEVLLKAIELLRGTDDTSELTSALVTLAGLRLDLGAPAEAETLYRETLEILEGAPDLAAEEPIVLDGLGIAVQRQGRNEEALEIFQSAKPLHAEHWGDPSLEASTNLNNIGFAQFYLQDLEGAAATFEEVLAMQLDLVEESHPKALLTIGNLGTTYERLGRLEESLEMHRRGLELRIERFGPEHPDVFFSRYGLARALARVGEHEEAIEHLEIGIGILEGVYGTAHEHIVRAAREAGRSNLALGRYDEAHAMHRRAFEAAAGVGDHRGAVQAIEDAATARQAQGRLDLALAELKQAEAHAREHLPTDGETEASILLARGLVHILAERWDEAVDALEGSVTLRRETLGSSHGRVGESLARLGDALVGAGRISEAKATLEEAIPILADAVGEEHWLYGEAHASLGIARLRAGDAAGAAELIAAAYPLIESGAGATRLAHVAGAMAEALALVGDDAGAAEWSALRDAHLAETPAHEPVTDTRAAS